MQMLDPRRILEIPAIYTFFQKIIRAEKGRHEFLKHYIIPLAHGGSLLEIGCGPGNNLIHIPADIHYVGCDLSLSYITYAQKRYGNRGQFFAVPVGKLAGLNLGQFDVIMAVALLHHLNDAEVVTLCEEVRGLLKPTGSFITADPCFVKEQSRIEHFITACDRGKFVRFPNQYSTLLRKRFKNVDMVTGRGGLLIPSHGVIFTATG